MMLGDVKFLSLFLSHQDQTTFNAFHGIVANSTVGQDSTLVSDYGIIRSVIIESGALQKGAKHSSLRDLIGSLASKLINAYAQLFICLLILFSLLGKMIIQSLILFIMW